MFCINIQYHPFVRIDQTLSLTEFFGTKKLSNPCKNLEIDNKMFRILKFVHINPFYLLILFGYGLTRFAEWIVKQPGTWSSIWHITSQFLDRHKPISYIFGLPLYVIAIHWIFAALSMLYDVTDCSRFLNRFRNQRKQKLKMETKELMSLSKIVLTNQLVILPASMVLNHYLLRFSNDLHLISFSKVPSFSRMFYKSTLCMMIYEVVFFYLFWMLHHPLIHKPVNKANTASTSNQHQQPLEYILLSIVTPSLAIFFTKCDTVTSLFFLTAIVVGPIFENSDLSQPLKSTNESRQEYQQFFNEYYGSNDILNILHGTCRNFLKSEKFENHRVLLTMKPPRRKCDE
ncbi:fatty acid hydroxylase domain-containing protein 2-like [Chironomus tepperi]|uniref:fatty acid hydroxylase domain-containing protein 2-like n=1 Tax=Chironomus tepperi TaxID=113505 RepID=UPI00391F7584